jgi:hypothetical protein
MILSVTACTHYGKEAEITHRCSSGSVIILNGTCGSGKSTAAEILLGKGFLAIDGDCVIQVVKHKKGTPQWDFNEVAAEIIKFVFAFPTFIYV